MQIPSLIEAGDERVADVLGVQPPGAMDDGVARCRSACMFVAPSDSQMPVPASATCITCLREVARRVEHVLVRGGDVAAPRCSRRSRNAPRRCVRGLRRSGAAARRGRRRRTIDCVVSIISSNLQRVRPASVAPVLERVARRRQRGDLLGRRDLRQRDDEVRRQRAAGRSSSVVRNRCRTSAGCGASVPR